VNSNNGRNIHFCVLISVLLLTKFYFFFTLQQQKEHGQNSSTKNSIFSFRWRVTFNAWQVAKLVRQKKAMPTTHESPSPLLRPNHTSTRMDLMGVAKNDFGW
jgi:hypothetical protein